MKKQKRQKYSNGSSVKQKTHQNVQAMEHEVTAKQKGNSFGQGSTSIPGGGSLNYSIFKNRDDKIRTVELKQPFGKNTLGIGRNKNQKSISIGRNGLELKVTKPNNGKTHYGVTFTKLI